MGKRKSSGRGVPIPQEMAKRTYALRSFEAADEFTGFKAFFNDMASLEKVIRNRSDVTEGSKLYWQASRADDLPMEWDNDAALPALPWVVVGSSQKGSPALPDGNQLLNNSMKPLPELPMPKTFEDFLFSDCLSLRIPVSQEASNLIQGTGHEAANCFIAASRPLDNATYFLNGQAQYECMTEDKTTRMMGVLLDSCPREIYRRLPQSSPCKVRAFSAKGNKAETRKSQPSTALAGKLQRPDMLCFVNGATVGIGEDKDEGDMASAIRDMGRYCASGFLPYHYGTVYMLPIYVAAGHRVAFGYYCQDGKVVWVAERSMQEPEGRAQAVLAVVQITRWWAAMETRFPPLEQRLKLLEADQRGHVTIIHSGRRVNKYIDDFATFLTDCSPGTSFDIIKKIYEEARNQKDELRFMVKATKLPKLSRHGRYSVELQAYGQHANPENLAQIWALLRTLFLTAQLLHSLGFVMRDFRRPNVLTRDHGQEGSYVTIDFEYAGPIDTHWSLPLLTDWDEDTLEQDGKYSAFSDMHQIGVLVTNLPFWGQYETDAQLGNLVARLLAKEYTATAALNAIPAPYA